MIQSLKMRILNWKRMKSNFLSNSALSKINSTLVILTLFVLPFNITKRIHQLQDVAHPFVRGIYSNYLYPTVSILDIFSILIVITGGWKKIKRYRTLQIFLAYLALHTLTHPNITTAIWSLRAGIYLIASTQIVYLLTNSKRFTTKFKIAMIFSILTSLVIQAFIAFWQVRKGVSIGLSLLGESSVHAGGFQSASAIIKGKIFLRGYGTFPHPNVLAGYLFTTYILSIAIYETIRNNCVTKSYDGKKLFFLFFAIINSLMIIISLLTFSKTIALSVLVTLSAILLAFIFRKISSLKLHVLFFISAAMFALVTILYQYGLQHIYTFFTSYETVFLRLRLAHISLNTIRSNPIFGIGAGNYVRTLSQVSPLTLHGVSFIQPVHNIYLLLATEHGVPATIIFVSFIAKRLVRLYQSNFKILTLMIAVFLLLPGVFDHYLISLPQGLFMLALIIGILIILPEKRKVL